jgi:CheY-like chemotaxis protein
LIAFDLRRVLLDRGATVIGPVGGLEMALEMVNSGPGIDGALIDINLQGEKAFPLVDALVKQDIPLVFATGYNAEVLPFRHRHIALHEKPVDPRKLVEAMVTLTCRSH